MFVSKKERWPNSKVIIHLCSAHIMKSITKKLSKITTDDGLKNFCSYVFATLMNSTDMREVGLTFSHLCDLLLHEKFGKHQEVLFNFNIIK